MLLWWPAKSRTPEPAFRAEPAAATRDWPRGPELKRAIALVDGLDATLVLRSLSSRSSRWRGGGTEKPSDLIGRNAEIWILLGLGRPEEAWALHRTAVEMVPRPQRVSGMTAWLYDPIPRCVLLGDRATALKLLREGAADAEGRKTIRDRLQADARMAPIREGPEVAVILAEPPR